MGLVQRTSANTPRGYTLGKAKGALIYLSVFNPLSASAKCLEVLSCVLWYCCNFQRLGLGISHGEMWPAERGSWQGETF